MAARVDTVFENATFHTMRRQGETVEALAVAGGVIVAAGPRADVRELAGPGTETVDLGGAHVFPGFADSHVHLLKAALAATYEIDLDGSGCRSVADVQDAVRSRAATLPSGTWIVGHQLRDEKLAEHRYPTRHDLDAATIDHPVLLKATGSHICVANSLALRLGGITAEVPDPPGGQIDRDQDGEPNGILRERGKLRLNPGASDSVIPDYTEAQGVDALEQISRRLVQAGVTCVGTMIVNGSEVRVHQRAARERRFAPRTRLMYRVIESEIDLDDLDHAGIVTGFGDDMLRVTGVKMSIDGGSLQKNAAMYEPYPGEPGNRGIVRIDQEELDATVARAHALGLRNVIHAIGDRAYDMALTAIEKGVVAKGATDHRTRIEHLGNISVSTDQLARALQLRVVASPQPGFIHVYGDKWIDIFGEEEVQRGFFPFRRMLDAGIEMIGSSDYGMTPVDCRVGIHAAVTRRTAEGTSIGPGQAITPYEAISLYTSRAAWCDFEEATRGTLEPGRLADLTALAANPLRVPADELLELPVTATVIGGESKYRNEDGA
ncbi:MAG TPA: amidohydrolase [Streptosporangiales bacterium]